MKLDLSEIAQNVGKRQKYTVDEPCWEEEEGGLRCVGSIGGEIEFSNTGRLLLARGKLQAIIELECGRCLTSFQTPVEAKIEEQFEIPLYYGGQPEVEEEPEIAIEPDPLFQDNIFDLPEFIRQTLNLSVPIQPLCEEVCKGLCSQCGQNLNIGKCDCPEIVESPLAELAQLLETDETGSGEGDRE